MAGAIRLTGDVRDRLAAELRATWRQPHVKPCFFSPGWSTMSAAMRRETNLV